MNIPVRALIFDMDGTIADTMRFHDDAWEQWHGRLGLPFDRKGFFAATAGRTGPEILGELFPGKTLDELRALDEIKEQLYRELCRPHLAPVAGLLDLLDRADDAGIPMAVGTAAPNGNVDFTLDGLGIRHRFHNVASPSQGFRGKPQPDLFLAAAERMGVAPEHCIVFEDAPLGIEAARRAGMRAVALLTSARAETFASFDNLIAAMPDFTTFDHPLG
ncbi:MAG: HAD family phosphatase [Rhizobiales bacterium]|nr:HAD family phosphatase [Hyphomicrobiales bacterium]